MVLFMNASEFKRWLKEKGCTFGILKSGSGHIEVFRGNRKSQLPMHGSRKELRSGLVHKIKRELGLK